MKTKKKSGKNLRKSGKSQGKIREFDGIKKVGTLSKVLTTKVEFFVSKSLTTMLKSSVIRSKHINKQFLLDLFSPC